MPMPPHLPILLLASSVALHALSGMPGLLMSRRTGAGQRLATLYVAVAVFVLLLRTLPIGALINRLFAR